MRLDGAMRDSVMRFLDMWNPFAISGREIASERRVEETITELYCSRPHILGTLGIVVAGASAGLSGSAQTGIAACLIVLTSLSFRIFMERRYRARTSPALDVKWLRLFVTGSLFSGFGWGLSGAILMYGTSAGTQAITMGVACAILQSTAGRAYMMPGTAFINIALVIGQISIAALANGDYILIPAFLLYSVFLTSFISQMVENRLQQLRAEQTTDRLIREITEKNKLLKVANEALAAKAHQDSLTGLANRRKFDMVLAESLTAAQQHGSDIALMMIDVDHFKPFNDTYGHQAGDECLQLLAKAIGDVIDGVGGFIARYGGEEFVAILPGETLARARITAERVRVAVRLTDLDALPNSPPRQTVSIGLVCCQSGALTTQESLLAAADAALYQAKNEGRNRICVHLDPDLQQPKTAI